MKRLLIALCLPLLAACGAEPVRPVAASPAVTQQQATSDQRQRAKVHTELGSLYLRDGKPAVALEEVRAGLRADAEYPPAYNLLGMIHMYLKEDRLAEENFERAYRLAPQDPEIANSYGWFLCQNGRESRALEYFQQALRNPLYATPTKALNNAGACYLRLKDDKAAEAQFHRALATEPGNAFALYWLSEIAFRQGRLTDAKARLSDLHVRVEPNAESSWLCVRIERRRGDREAEIRCANTLRRRFPESPQFERMTQGKYD